MQHLLSIQDLSRQEINGIFDLSSKVKSQPASYREALKGKTLAMIFQKPSTRTRVSFEAGIFQLGGMGLYLSTSDLQIGRGETIADTARVLSRYADGIVARVFEHEQLLELARYSRVPIINGLSDLLHPCQALTDYFTILEKRGTFAEIKVAYIGDGNNVAHSLINGAAKLGVMLCVATPAGYAPRPEIVAVAQSEAVKSGATICLTQNPQEAAREADVLYTDVWTSMGQEVESRKRQEAFTGFQINAAMLRLAKPNCIFMHCLPAHRGEEVTHEVMESAASVVFDEAENRLHVQKAIMILLMGGAAGD